MFVGSHSHLGVANLAGEVVARWEQTPAKLICTWTDPGCGLTDQGSRYIYISGLTMVFSSVHSISDRFENTTALSFMHLN